ncbi:TcpQ domain-containing protein [Salmonella enterica]|nr:TcpQ domain-containing protein [Salmonella enterica]ELW6564711.1 TcpQ domain-containing protein [Salmonella enterica]ELZ1404349.1 TcpQ domain-containing protein [Salmonella enterica]
MFTLNTYTFFCPGLLLVLAGCAQSPAASSARDAAFSHGLKPAAPADIWQRSPEVTRKGRYTLVSVKSADAQREPLNQLIDITMPVSLVSSVGDGFRYLLFQSGYSLCGRYGADFAELLNRPLPAVQRRLGPVRLSEALQVVAGPAWRMTVDEVNREVCFVLRDAYLAQARPGTSPATTTTASPVISSPAPASAAGTPSLSAQPGRSETLPLPAVPVLSVASPGQGVAAKTTAASPSVSAAGTTPAATSTGGVTSTSQVKAKNTASAPAGRNPFSGSDLTGKNTVTAAVASSSHPVSPVASASSSLTPSSAPASSAPAPAPKLTGTPVKAQSSGPEWKAAAGITLQESLTAWAEKADCPNGGHWVVIWQTPVDYLIEAPLTFRGSFESALDQVFDLYRPAEKRLYAEANRTQCLVSVTGRPVDR